MLMQVFLLTADFTVKILEGFLFQQLLIVLLEKNHCFVDFMLQGRGFSKAMTAKEAEAFVGDETCVVTILEDDKLFLVAPSSRHRRDTSSEAMELLVRDCSPQTSSVVLTNFTLRSKFLVFFRSNLEMASGESALYALRGNLRFLFTS